MVKFRKFMQSIDIYGIPFEFQIFQHRRYSTYIGSFFSIASLWSIIGFVFLFGKNFIFRKNPSIISSFEIPNDYKKEYLNDSQLQLPWRIEDWNGVPVDFEGVLYPIVFYLIYEKDPVTNEIVNNTRYRLNYTKCESNPNIEEAIDYHNYYCVDFSNIPLGGSMTNQYYYYFSVYLSFCPNGIYSTDPEDNCTPQDELNEMNGYWKFVMWYPEHYFQPNEIKEPLKLRYRTYSQVLAIELQKEDYFHFQKVQFKDDQGLIWNTEKTFSFWALSEHNFEYYYFSQNYLYTEGILSYIYYSGVIIDKNYVVYSRVYMKFQDLCANVGGIIKLVMAFFEMCVFFFNHLKLDSWIINHLFYTKRQTKMPSPDKPSIFEKSTSKINDCSNQKSDRMVSTNNIQIIKTSVVKLKPIGTENELKTKVTSNYKNLYASSSINQNKNTWQKDIESPILGINQWQKSKPFWSHNVVSTSYGFLICSKYCKRTRMNTTYNQRIYFYALKELNKKKDGTRYLESWREIEWITAMILNKNQLVGFNYMNKKQWIEFPNVYNNTHPNEKEENVWKIKEMINYFQQRAKYNDYDTKIDRIIRDNLNNEYCNN